MAATSVAIKPRISSVKDGAYGKLSSATAAAHHKRKVDELDNMLEQYLSGRIISEEKLPALKTSKLMMAFPTKKSKSAVLEGIAVDEANIDHHIDIACLAQKNIYEQRHWNMSLFANADLIPASQNERGNFMPSDNAGTDQESELGANDESVLRAQFADDEEEDYNIDDESGYSMDDPESASGLTSNSHSDPRRSAPDEVQFSRLFNAIATMVASNSDQFFT